MLKRYFEWFWAKAKEKRKSQILELLEPNTRARLLDCGCDDGKYTLEWGRKVGTNRLYGIEINHAAAQEAEIRKIKVKRSDLNFRFPYEDRTFNIVTADQVIEHLWDLDNFASEIYRVLKPGGYAIISTENLASWHNVGALLLGLQPFSGPTISSRHVLGFHPLTSSKTEMAKKHKHTPDMPSHIKVVTLTGLITLFNAYDFKIEAVKAAGYFPLPPFLSGVLEALDKRHSFFITIKVRKP